MFVRPRHMAILSALRALDGDLFAQARCYFGGGTAIVLALGEYRESADIDFLCSSQEGYRTLREAVWHRGFDGLLIAGQSIKALRELKADQYGIRTFIESNGTAVKFEIVREARVELAGAIDVRFGLPVLARDDMYAEKLLANADRWADRSVRSRDVIDLAMMVSRWGPIPDAAWQKARTAYGTSVDAAYEKALDMISDRNWLADCLAAMHMEPQLIEEILASRMKNARDE